MANYYYRGTMFFELEAQGWSESWIRQQPTPSSDLTDVRAQLIGLAQTRAGILGAGVNIVFLKTTDLNAGMKRRVDLFKCSYATGDTDQTLPGDVAALTRFQNTSRSAFSLRPLRGVPSLVDDHGALKQPLPDPYKTNLLAYQNSLAFGLWGWYQINPTLSAPILAVTTAITGQVVIQTTSPIWTTGEVRTAQRVRIRGVQGATQINGSFVVHVTAVDTFYIVKALATFPYITNTGSVQRYGTPNWNNVGALTVTDLSKRGVGRPSFQPRGRRPSHRVTA